MSRKFSELRARMSPEAQERAAIQAKKMLAERPLDELRQAGGSSQKMLAEALHAQRHEQMSSLIPPKD